MKTLFVALLLLAGSGLALANDPKSPDSETPAERQREGLPAPQDSPSQAPAGVAPVTTTGPVKSVAEIRQILDELVARSFPELEGRKIKIRTFDSDAFYFRSRPTIGSFVRWKKQAYVIDVNTRVFQLEPPREAVIAILAHELCHSSHYASSSRGTVVKELRMFFSQRRMSRFERRTDLDAMSRGYAKGLILYREWIYPTLDKKSLAKKRKSYLTPEEILLVEGVRGDHADLLAEWQQSPPRTLAGFEESLARHLAAHAAERKGGLSPQLEGTTKAPR